MTHANVEIVQRLYANWTTDGYSQPDKFLEFLDADIVWDASHRAFDAGIFHGHDEVMDFFARLLEVWESGRVEPIEFIAMEDEVVVPVRLHLVSRTQRETVSANAAHVWTLREGKIVKHCAFQTKAEALAAVGLPE